jgi:hypothetical protein
MIEYGDNVNLADLLFPGLPNDDEIEKEREL